MLARCALLSVQIINSCRPRQPMLPAFGGPAVLGQSAPMPGLATAFAHIAAVQDAAAAVGLGLKHQGTDALGAAPAAPVTAPAPRPGPKAGRGRMGAQHQMKTVDKVLAELHAQVGELSCCSHSARGQRKAAACELC